MVQGVMFDSNAFDKILDGSLKIDDLEKSKNEFDYYITHIQTDELSNVPDSKKDKRQTLVLYLANIRPRLIPTSCAVWDNSKWGFSKWGGGKYYEKLVNDFKNNINDAIIGDTAISEDLILVTNDNRLKNKVIELGGKAKTVSEFLEMIKEDVQNE